MAGNTFRFSAVRGSQVGGPIIDVPKNYDDYGITCTSVYRMAFSQVSNIDGGQERDFGSIMLGDDTVGYVAPVDEFYPVHCNISNILTTTAQTIAKGEYA